MPTNPAIVISAYNRPASLKRLLHALERGVYAGGAITLIISIDKSGVAEVKALAEAFEWKHGPKKIITHAERLGLKAHILKCGELALSYESIILLEDDLVVSPYFYEYAKQAQAFYENDPGIAGISLYNYQVAESCFYPFSAIDDGSDVYFMQVASSWGQLWTKDQWILFADWFAGHPELPQQHDIPEYIRRWGPHSWKKHFMHYLVDTNRYFVFPRLSLSSNPEDAGTHAKTTGLFQVPLQTAPKEFAFKMRDASTSVYDAWFELLPSCLSRMNKRLKDIDYSVDLYGTKIPALLKSNYILSSRKGKVPLLSFGRELFPAEANIAMDLPGEQIGLYEIKDTVFTDQKLPLRRQETKKEERFIISVVIPVETAGAGALQATLDSVAGQTYSNKKCILVTLPAAEDTVKTLAQKYTLDIQIVSASPNTTLAELVMQGLSATGDGLLSWALPGSTFATNAFDKAASIFESNAGVSWIRGIDKDDSQIAGLNTTAYRLTPGEAYRRIERRTLDVSTELDLFRRHCLKNSGGQASFSSLFFDLISAYQLVVVVTRLGTKHSLTSLQVTDSEQPALLAGYAHLKTKMSWQKSVFSFLLKTPLFNADSRQWYGAALNNLPDVLRYDTEHNTFYFHKY